MSATDEIDNLIATHNDWRGVMLADLRRTILEVDPGIVEAWKYMGSPVWELAGMICVGNIFKDKVKLVFADGVALADTDGLFNAELAGNKRRGIDYFETAVRDDEALQRLIRRAIEHNEAKAKK